MTRYRIFYLMALLFLFRPVAWAQTENSDSITVVPIAKYDSVSSLHRKFFGENYRREYAQATQVPVIRLSRISGGLKAVQRGGGKQSRSLRLLDAKGMEWSLRSVQKYPGVLLPEPLRQTFLLGVIEDNMSAQHPFGALVVPPLAQAAAVAHSNPIIGWVAPDPGLGGFATEFENTLCLLEQREPLGKSDNTTKMLGQLSKSHDFRVDWKAYLKAKALDVLIGDWDRHEDQWRWSIDSLVERGLYIPVPRDRDQVFYRSDGLVQRFAQSSWLLPMMQGYERDLNNVNWFLWEGRNVNTRVFSGVELDSWNATIREFCVQMSDSVLEDALSRLPDSSDRARRQQLLDQMKRRRDLLPELMENYYRFFNKVVDIVLSDKDELVNVKSIAGYQLQVDVNKLVENKSGGNILSRRFDPSLTREIRIFLNGGCDSVALDSISSKIKLRIVGGADEKKLNFNIKGNQVTFYGKLGDRIEGKMHMGLRKRISSDTANLGYAASDRYKRSLTLLNAGFNNDDGIMLGLLNRSVRPGFRKTPYASAHTFSFLYSWRTSALNFHYTGEWKQVAGNNDLLLDLRVNAPNNARNFFGVGNETQFDREVNSIGYYRARFDFLDFRPSIRHQWARKSLSFGPLLQYYNYGADQNAGRFIERYLQTGNSEIVEIARSKAHLGAGVRLLIDTKDNEILPRTGIVLKSNLEFFSGITRYANDMGSVNSQFAFFLSLNGKGTIVLSDRIGGG